MGNPDPVRPAVRIEPVSPGNDRATVELLTGWVTDGPADAWEYLASHTDGEGASLVTVRAGRVIGKLSGGHRHATHSFLGIALFTGLAWVSCHYRGDWAGKAGLALLMTLSVSAGLEALRIVRGHLADVIGIAVASWEVWFGYGLRLIPLAVFLGCSTHIIGDMLTDSGCMLTFPLSRQRYHLLPEPLAFTTGTGPELLIVDPVLTAALLVLALWAADPAFVAAHWHELAG